MSIQSDYVYKHSKAQDFEPMQSVIFKKSFLHCLPWFQYKEESPQPPPLDEWYPLVNSYYAFTEDVDAFARVHQLIESKPPSSHSSTVKDQCINKERISEYSGLLAQQRFLRSSPICFFILGKPGLGEEELGRQLAEHWNCTYINPQVLLEEEILNRTRAGQCIEFNLRCGRAIGVDIIVRLLVRKVQTPTVHHRGFVLCGFPLVPNNLYEEDPISSESAVFTVQDIFEDIIDTVVAITDHSAKVAVSLDVSVKDVSEVSEKISVNDTVDPNVLPQGSAGSVFKMEWGSLNESHVCGPPDIGTDLDKQMSTLFALFSNPYFLVYIYGTNSDIVFKRNHYYFDIYSKASVDFFKINLFYDVGATNDELVEDLFSGGKNPFADNPNMRHLARSVENLPVNVSIQLDRYHTLMTNALDCRVILHDPHYFIKLDGRLFISEMMQLVRQRLKVLPLQPPPAVHKFVTFHEEPAAEDAKTEQPEQETVEEAFLKFSKLSTIAPIFKWVWSDWGVFCPVSMYGGTYQQGSSKFAVHFMDKIFFLANEKECEKFKVNPRPYLLPPFPRPGCKILVFGPPISGKSVVAKCLGYLLNAKVFTPVDMRGEYMHILTDEHVEKVKQAALAEALELLTQQRQIEYEEKMEKRKKDIDEWETSVVNLLMELKTDLITLSVKSFADLSLFPVKVEIEVEKQDEKVTLRSRETAKKLTQLNLPLITDLEFCKNLLSDRELIYPFLPQHLQAEPEIEQATVFDPFVEEYVKQMVDNIAMDELVKAAESNIAEMYIRTIRAFQHQTGYAGWIVDGMTTQVDILTQLFEEFSIDDIVILTTSDYDFLLERFKNPPEEPVNFRQFFLNIGEKEAAWRVPSGLSLQSYDVEVLSLELEMTEVYEDMTLSPEDLANRYEEHFKVHEKEIENVRGFLEQLGRKPVDVDVTHLPIEGLLQNAINELRNRYRKGASEFTDDDRAEELQQYLAQSVYGGEGEGGDQLFTEYLEKNRRYGDTLYYCPVTFFNDFVLWRGKDRFGAKFNDKIYFMTTETNMRNFIDNPRQYLMEPEPAERFPPPRICVVGLPGTGKTTVAKVVSKNLGIRYLNYEDLRNSAVDAPDSSSLALMDESAQEVPKEDLLQTWQDNFISRICFEKPMKHIGFVLDNFPAESRDLDYLIGRTAIPDIIICTSVNRDENLRRMVDKSLKIWEKLYKEPFDEKSRLNALKVQEWEEQRKARFEELMEIKRQTRYQKKINVEDQGPLQPISEEEAEEELVAETGLLSETQVSFNSVAEQEEAEEVMKIVDEEFPELELEEIEQTEAQCIEKATLEFEEQYAENVNKLNELRQICDAELIPWIESDGNLPMDRIRAQAFRATDQLKFRSNSFFERCYDVSLETAEKLLLHGYYLLSSFGRTCPFQYFKAQNPLQMYFVCQEKNQIYPVIHRQYIYFLAGKEAHFRFTKNPFKYLHPQNFCYPLVSMRVAVIGPPKSGTTTLANRFRRDLGFTLVTRGQAIRTILKHPLYVHMTESLEKVLRKGKTLSDDLVMNCVNAASFCGESLTQGLVFDGFPNTIAEVRLLSRLGLVPHLIFDLQATEETIYESSRNATGKDPLYSQRFIHHIFEQWNETQSSFRDWCDKEYQNIYRLPVDRSCWGVWDQAKEVTLAAASERKHYYKYAKCDWPLRIGYMLVTPLELCERQNRGYKYYCPVCLYRTCNLNCGGDPPDRTGLVHYRDYFYWICDTHIEEFLVLPDIFLPPSNRTLPQDLPDSLHLTEMPDNVAEKGYCMMCYKKNLPKKVFVKGDLENAVSYKDLIYLFDTKECLQLFMNNPEFVMNLLSTNFDENESDVSLEYRDLPPMGMLEQYVARTVVRATHHVSIHRPVIPGLSISASALVCMGLNLKVFNPKTPQHLLPVYHQSLNVFHEKRSNLLTYLSLMKQFLNPFVPYEEPSSSDDPDADDPCHRNELEETSSEIKNTDIE